MDTQHVEKLNELWLCDHCHYIHPTHSLFGCLGCGRGDLTYFRAGSMLTAECVKDLVEEQLSLVPNAEHAERIRELLVTPYCVDQPWDYGDPGHTYPCWRVLKHEPSGTGIAYCEYGFGPKFPWGLVSTIEEGSGMGDDSGWLKTLEEAFLNSWASQDELEE